MSVAKVTYVKRSRKPYECEKCREELPVGSAYKWFVVGFRDGWTHIRCMKPSCDPKPSERESSQMATVLAAIESAQDELDALEINGLDDVDSMTSIAEQVVDALNEVADIYEEADRNFGGGGNTDMAEKADNLRSVADELSSWSPDFDEPEFCDIHTDETTALESDPQFTEGDNLDEVRAACDDCREKISEWVDFVKSELRDKLDEALSV